MPQCEAKCETIDMKMIFDSHANKSHLHKKGLALNLVLRVKVLGARKGMAHRPSFRWMKLICTNWKRDSGMKCTSSLILLTICPNREPTGKQSKCIMEIRKYRRFSRMRPSKYHFSPRHFICSLLWYSDITPVYPERNLLVKLIMILGLVCPFQQIKITLPLRLIILKTGR